MVFTSDTISSLMQVPEKVRNVTVIAHVDHGKSTLTDALLAGAGLISASVIGSRVTDNTPDEQEKGITIKSTGISLVFPDQIQPDNKYLINLIDSPGHVDFSSEVTAALRLTDGALVLVDCVEGCCVQTETVLRQALRERIKPVLAINKLDRLLFMDMDADEIFQSFRRAIEYVNLIIAMGSTDEQLLGDWQVYPEKGTVAFTCGKQGWGFTLKQFAKIYAKKFPTLNEDKLIQRLWGEYYYDTETKKWSTNPTNEDGKLLVRGFCKFILEPIIQLGKLCSEGDMSKLDKILKTINVTLTTDEQQNLKDKHLFTRIMQKWFPCADGVVDMMITHLPSPSAAQKYRAEVLYQGPLDDETAQAIRSCDPKGPLVVFVSKTVPTSDKSRFIAFGRVFSGTLSQGQKVRILGPNYVPGNKKEDLFTNVPIQRTLIMMGKKVEPVTEVPCGNTVGIVGIDQYLTKSCTLTTLEDSHPLVNMKYSVAPVVRAAVSPKSPSDLLKLVESMKRLAKSDPLVQCTVENTGEHIVACAGELHLQTCIKTLKEYMNDAELKVSDPVVTFQETVTTRSNVVCLAKSPNSFNRLYVTADPIQSELVNIMESQRLAKEEPKARARLLVEQFNWDVTDARNIWCFGPGLEEGTNVVVNSTKGVQYLHEVKDSVVAAFQWVAKEGILAEESMRGIRFTIHDALLHSDAIHRGGGQVIPAARRVFYASQLTATPTLMEPVFLVDIQCPTVSLNGIYNVLNQRRGTIIEAILRSGSMYQVKAYLPVMESFGFSEHLRSETSGQAFPQCLFDHWQVINGDVFSSTGYASSTVNAIRKRKGLSEGIPALSKYLDKL